MSIADIPVAIISSGYTWLPVSWAIEFAVSQAYPRIGIDGTAIDIEVVLRKHLRPLINGSA